MILVLADDDDAHVHEVTKHFIANGIDFLTIGIANNFGTVGFQIDEDSTLLTIGNRVLKKEDITAVWDRSRSSMPILADENWQYAYRERKTFLESIYAFNPNAKWINPLSNSVRAGNKIFQLMVAKRAGLKIPSTVVTNDAEKILSGFPNPDQRIVFKALSWLAMTDGRVLFTNEVDRDILLNNQDKLKWAPCIFQNKIEKQFELRVTCIANEIFAAKINSQVNAMAELDWRREQMSLEYEAFALPKGTETALRQIMDDLGIVYGAFDLAYTNEGFVFFEVNPSGNWLWLEESVSMPISERIAEYLMRPLPTLSIHGEG